MPNNEIVMTPWGSPERLRELQIQALRAALGERVAVTDAGVTVDGVSVEEDLELEVLEFDEQPADVVARVLVGLDDRAWHLDDGN
jgi:hypothetical protein